MARVLLIAQAFPPVAGSHTTRVLALANELQKKFLVRGISIEVGEGYPQRDDRVTLGFDITRTSPGFIHRYAHNNPQVSGQIKSESEHTSSMSPFTSFKTYLINLGKGLYRKVEIIDSYFDWIPYLTAGIKENLSKNDILVSTSMPNSTHVATLIALSNRKNIWIADFGDPWTIDHSLPRSGLRKWVENIIERGIFMRADGISFTTEATLKDYMDKYPSCKSKMFLARMGFSEEDAKIKSGPIREKTVFYGGSLPSENRDASEFLSCISNLPDIDFTFAGSSTQTVRSYFKNHIPQNIKLVPWMSHDDFIRNLKENEICVVFGNQNYQQVPGKIYQIYKFSNKILYVSNRDPSAHDESFDIIKGVARRSFNNRVSIENQLLWLLDNDEKQYNHANDYSWENNFNTLVNYIDSLIVDKKI